MIRDSAFSSHCLATSSSSTLMLLLANICLERERLDYLADVLTLRDLQVSSLCFHIPRLGVRQMLPMAGWHMWPLQTNSSWHAALNAQSHSMCWSAKHPQTVHFPICESFSPCPGFFFLDPRHHKEKHMDTPCRHMAPCTRSRAAALPVCPSAWSLQSVFTLWTWL